VQYRPFYRQVAEACGALPRAGNRHFPGGIMSKRLKMGAVLGVLATCLAVSAASLRGADEARIAAVKEVILKAYVEGVHINRDAEAMRKGFHPEFRMMVYGKDGINPVTIDQWASSVAEGKRNTPNPAPRKVEHKFAVVDLEGNAAVVRVELFFDAKHVFTDYLSLYEFNDGWKIVGKIFYRHP
jgi:hypothetical protein